MDGGGGEQCIDRGRRNGMTDVLNTQIAIEQWNINNPDGRLTQIALEQWSSVPAVTIQALVTQIVLEQWSSTAEVGRGYFSAGFV